MRPTEPDVTIKSRDLMAPDTEPTDEDLAIVMREARDLAMQRKAASDQRMRELLAKAVSDAFSRSQPVPGR
jgi:hypothetical protein